MNIYFDVDYTLIAMDGSLRPGTTEVFEGLIADGHLIYIWSGVGMRTDDIERLGLSGFVSLWQDPRWFYRLRPSSG